MKEIVFIPKIGGIVRKFEDSIGITYKLYRQNQLMYTLVEENFKNCIIIKDI